MGTPMLSEPVRAVLIGTGSVAVSHVQALRSVSDRVTFAAAMDIDEDRARSFCAANGIPSWYGDVDDLLKNEQPELVLIATPSATHCDLSMKCLEAGAWVLCEKPLCGSLEEMDRIEDAEHRTGNFCASVFQWRFGSGGKHVKSLLDSGALGRPLVCNSLVTWYRTPVYYAVPWRGKWETELGGASMTLGIHAMDLVLWLLGEWEEVRAMMGTIDRDIEVENVSMASVRFASGAMANIATSALSPRESSYLRLDTQKATVELTHLYRYTNDDWRFSAPAGAAWEDEVEQWSRFPEDYRCSHDQQLRELLDSMQLGERPAASGPDVRSTIEFMASLYKSALSGEAVKRGTIMPGDPYYRSMCGPCKMSGGEVAQDDLNHGG